MVSGKGFSAYRGRQIYRWIYWRAVTEFEEMTDLPLNLRGKLEEQFVVHYPATAARQRSRDGTVKYLFSLGDGKTVEAVYIPDRCSSPGSKEAPSRHTLCLSTQVGCPLGCTFCFSGTVAFSRNLTAGEILGQFLRVKKDLDPTPSRINVVFMGMGEPLLNSGAVLTSLEILTAPDGFAVSPRRVTVSTAGPTRELEEFARKAPPVGLAVSLHATTNETRGRIMPINRKYPLETLMETVRHLPLPRRRRITFEYVLLGGENDSAEDAERLASLLRGARGKVNLINYNPWPGSPHRPSSPKATERFMQILLERGLTASLRRSRGDDILAACGQLAGVRSEVKT